MKVFMWSGEGRARSETWLARVETGLAGPRWLRGMAVQYPWRGAPGLSQSDCHLERLGVAWLMEVVRDRDVSGG